MDENKYTTSNEQPQGRQQEYVSRHDKKEAFQKQQNLVRAFFEDVLTLLEKSHAANAGEVAKMRERLPEIFD